MADLNACYQFLDNLYSNAIKYSPAWRRSLRPHPRGAAAFVWEVQDHGAGLSEAEQAKLFQKFTKLSTRPTGGESSTGLGLSIVKMLSTPWVGMCLPQPARLGQHLFAPPAAAAGANQQNSAPTAVAA